MWLYFYFLCLTQTCDREIQRETEREIRGERGREREIGGERGRER
jgi:hypothetical protein